MTPNPPNALSTLSDGELNKLFAVEVDGWLLTSGGGYVTKTGMRGFAPLPNYCADANAVLPWLEKSEQPPRIHRALCHKLGWLWYVDLNVMAMGIAPTFPRAAVIALLTAKRAETK